MLFPTTTIVGSYPQPDWLIQSRGVKFVRGKIQEPYGTVTVFADLYGNQWDLIELVNSYCQFLLAMKIQTRIK